MVSGKRGQGNGTNKSTPRIKANTRRQKSEGRGQKAMRLMVVAFRELVNWLVISAALH
jgi:site-specific recombinase XerC